MKFLKEDHIVNEPTISGKGKQSMPPNAGYDKPPDMINTNPKGMDINLPHNTWNMKGSKNGGART